MTTKIMIILILNHQEIRADSEMMLIKKIMKHSIKSLILDTKGRPMIKGEDSLTIAIMIKHMVDRNLLEETKTCRIKEDINRIDEMKWWRAKMNKTLKMPKETRIKLMEVRKTSALQSTWNTWWIPLGLLQIGFSHISSKQEPLVGMLQSSKESTKIIRILIKGAMRS